MTNVIPSAEDEYMAFGLSGSEDSSRMEGADVAVAYMDDTRGYATDYNITAKATVREFIDLTKTTDGQTEQAALLMIFHDYSAGRCSVSTEACAGTSFSAD